MKDRAIVVFLVALGFTAQNTTKFVRIGLQPTQLSMEVPLASVNGWLTILSRVDIEFPIDLPSSSYEAGFGDIAANFWLGLSRIYQLTNLAVNGGHAYKLRFEFQRANSFRSA